MIQEVLQSALCDDPVGATWAGGARCIATNSLVEELSRKSVPGTELVLPLTSAVSLSCGARGYSSARTRARYTGPGAEMHPPITLVDCGNAQQAWRHDFTAAAWAGSGAMKSAELGRQKRLYRCVQGGYLGVPASGKSAGMSLPAILTIAMGNLPGKRLQVAAVLGEGDGRPEAPRDARGLMR